MNKNVCLKVAEYYTWVYEGQEAPVMKGAQEIYAHAIITYRSNEVKYDSKVLKLLADRTGQIDLGEEGIRAEILPPFYSFVWKHF